MRGYALAAVLMLESLAGCQAQNFSEEIAASSLRQFFVATNGNDTWSGALATPNAAKTDGPLASVEQALEKVRAAKNKGYRATLSNPWRIAIGEGTFFLRQPLVIRPADSDLRLIGQGQKRTSLSGGKKIGGWQKVNLGGKALWAAKIPEARDGDWYFRELWVNGKRAVRARHPNKGYLAIAEVPDKTAQWNEGQARFQVRETDLPPWPALTNAEVVAMTRWVESRLPVAKREGEVISFGKKSVFQLSAGDLYYVEHALEALDQPGEWYLDQVGGTLYYMPGVEDRIESFEAIGPVLPQIVRLEGKPVESNFVENVHFSGLTFSHSEWYFPPRPAAAGEKAEEPVSGFAQAAVGVPGAVWGEGVRHCSFERCSFANLGGYGLELAKGCQDNSILTCEFTELGGGGVKLGETAIRGPLSERSYGNIVSNCRIHDGGKMFHSAIGVWIGQSPSNRIVHNEIYNFYYTGISIGWTWGYANSMASNNLVAFNHVHHIGVQSNGDGPILSDMGGIYTLGRQPGTRIWNNLWHDIAAFRYGGWGIYFDEGSSGIIAESNVVYRTTHGGFHQHYGETNIVRNNIFAFARDHQLQRTRVEPHSSFSFQTNIVYYDSGVLLAGDWGGDNYQLDSNLYFDARPALQAEAMRFGNDPLEKWRARGHDRHSLVANPLFVAPSKNNFALPPNSPALRLGFKPIDLRLVGPASASAY
jgi:hypothetical protein